MSLLDKLNQWKNIVAKSGTQQTGITKQETAIPIGEAVVESPKLENPPQSQPVPILKQPTLKYGQEVEVVRLDQNNTTPVKGYVGKEEPLENQDNDPSLLNHFHHPEPSDEIPTKDTFVQSTNPFIHLHHSPQSHTREFKRPDSNLRDVDEELLPILFSKKQRLYAAQFAKEMLEADGIDVNSPQGNKLWKQKTHNLLFGTDYSASGNNSASKIHSEPRNGELLLEELERALPLKIKVLLQKTITPLSTSANSIPAQRDLKPFWIEVETAIKGLGPQIRLDMLEHSHIINLMPVILGPIFMRHTGQFYMNWEDFKLTIEKYYGVTPRQIKAAFWNLKRGINESGHDFILRVEGMRSQYGYDSELCETLFSPQLPSEFKKYLNVYRMMMTASTNRDIRWEDLVRMATKQRYDIQSEGNKQLKGMEPWKEEDPPPGTIGYTHKVFGKIPAPSKLIDPVFNTEETNRYDCAICSPLGLGGKHPTRLCYGNPENPQCRNNVVRSRMLQAKKFNIEIEQFKGKNIPNIEQNQKTLPLPPKVNSNTSPPDAQHYVKEDEVLQFIKGCEELSQLEGYTTAEAIQKVLSGKQQEEPEPCHMFGEAPDPSNDINNSRQALETCLKNNGIHTQEDFLKFLAWFSAHPNLPSETQAPAQAQNKDHTLQYQDQATSAEVTDETLGSWPEWYKKQANRQAKQREKAKLKENQNQDEACNMFEDTSEFHGMTTSSDDGKKRKCTAKYLQDLGIKTKQDLEDYMTYNAQLQASTFDQEMVDTAEEAAGEQEEQGEKFIDSDDEILGDMARRLEGEKQAENQRELVMEEARKRKQLNVIRNEAADIEQSKEQSGSNQTGERRTRVGTAINTINPKAIRARTTRIVNPSRVKVHLTPKPLALDTVGKALDKFKIQMSLQEALFYKEQLFDAVSLMVARTAIQTGRSIFTINGKTTRPINEEQILPELAMAKVSSMKQDGKEESIGEIGGQQAQSVHNKDNVNLTTENHEKIQSLLSEMTPKEAKEVMDDLPEDAMYWSKEPNHNYIYCPTGSTALPSWVSPNAKNFRGLIKPTTQHYLAIVEIGDGVIEALLDTGGARCMIDTTTADKLGLTVEVATTEKNWGSFFGPNDKSIPYYGRIKGPITIGIGPGIYLTVADIKVIKHRSPLLLLGTDVLVNSWNDWRFHTIGIDKVTKKGIMNLTKNSDDSDVTIELSSWPAPVDENGKRREEWAGIQSERYFLYEEVNTKPANHPQTNSKTIKKRPYQDDKGFEVPKVPIIEKKGDLQGLVMESPERCGNENQRKKTKQLKISEEQLKNFFRLKAQFELGQRVQLSQKL